MKRTLVTGGTGFVGANLARRLLADGHTVHLLVRPGYHDWRIAEIRDAVVVHEVDMRDRDALDAVLRTVRPDWVFHLAVHGAYPSQRDTKQIVETNIVSTCNLVEAALAAGVEAFVNTGSSSEYGFKDHAPSETEWLEPNSMYAVTKASATLFCRYIAQSQHVRMPTLRLYSVYGPYEEPTRLIPTVIAHGMRGALPPLVDPEIGRDFVYVDDVVRAYLMAAASAGGEPGAVYNVGTGIQTTIREVVAVARAELGIPAEPAWGTMAGRQWDTHVWVANNERIRRELNWSPAFTFSEGFRRMVEWLRNRPSLHARYAREEMP
jgi:nucleoside-diphosphate-sugar epimerase